MISSNWIRRNWFLLGLVLAVLLAWVFPNGGSGGGGLPIGGLVNGGVILIFLLQGLTLASEQVWQGLVRWRLHLLIQIFIFGITPLVAIGLTVAAGRLLPPDLAIGFVFLGALPTTISSALVFTTLAGGNVTLALVNTTLSNLGGILLTPLWVSAFAQVQGTHFSLGPVILKIALLILLPLCLGQILRRRLHQWADRRRKQFGTVSSLIVLFIVYTSFCESVVSGFWGQTGAGVTLGATGLVVLYFACVMILVLGAVRFFGVPIPDSPAVVFCGSHKTLAAGVPMAKLIFAAHPGLGLILLPIMLYHPLQLIVGGVLIGRFQRMRG
ncbi:MAG: bile acid:sodium symporter family protein [Opitutaceae bacterium]